MNMIKITNVKVYGLEDSIKAAKFPKSVNVESCTSELTTGIKSLSSCAIGEGHDNFLNGIVVQFDLRMPVKLWTELQRYHFIDFVSSQSQMHCITKFNLKEQYDRHVDSRIIDIIQEKVNEYNRLESLQKENYNSNRQEIMNELYLDILMSNPAGFNLTARMTTNYRQLKTMKQQRKYHRLPGWKEFCAWVDTLPRFLELTEMRASL